MRYLKHFAFVGKSYLRRFGCKHLESHTASCPYTGLTYTTCDRCLFRIKVEETNG